jgi:small subunit ribosomal protein S14
VYNCCSICGRTRWYLGKFDICRICFREKANAWELPGVRKSSW